MRNKVNQIRIFAAMLLAVALIPIASLATPIVKIKTEYYLVRGRTAQEIRSDLNRKTPIKENGVKYDGYTSWDIRWDFWWNKSHGRCSITTVKTKVDIQYTLPKLQTKIALSQSLQRKWDNYMQALMSHETEHKNIRVRAANEIEQKIKNMASRPSCKQLEVDANRLGYETIEKYNRLDDKFDHLTNHGINDGAVFP